MTFVETDCTVTHEGKTFEAGGSVITPDFVIGYFSFNFGDHVIKTWHGEIIGKARITSRWRLTGYATWASDMYQVEATINGIKYTGRTQGDGMIWKGKRKASQSA
jgi:hypothetical protein